MGSEAIGSKAIGSEAIGGEAFGSEEIGSERQSYQTAFISKAVEQDRVYRVYRAVERSSRNEW